MRKVRGAACVVLGLGVLIGCSTFRDQSKAMVGGGAVAGRDYINGLKPSEKARAYFAQNASDGSKAVTISRTGDGANDTGVRFVANGGVVIPPGTSITFENQGYCCDPHLPAPKAGDEYQFVKTSQLIPEQLQPIYRKLLTKASNGDEATLRSMQKLVWALRTAGTEAGYANNLTDNEKRILNSCSEYEGEFELYCSEKLAMSRFWKKLLAKADSYTTINVGGVTYQASDLLDDKVCEKKIKAHLDQLVTLGESMPVEHNGFNYGELENGIYTDIKGTGYLKFKATVANSTSQPFTFYPMDYIAQVGSGVSDESESVVYYATASMTQKQRVTIIPQDEIEVQESEENTPERPSVVFIKENHQVRNLDDAIDQFDNELRTISNHKNSNLEYYMYYIKCNGKIYVTTVGGNQIIDDPSSSSRIMKTSIVNIPRTLSGEFGKHNGDVIVVIHSHPPSDNRFSQTDKNSVDRGFEFASGRTVHQLDCVLLDTGSEHSSESGVKYDRYIMRHGHSYRGDQKNGYVGELL